MKRLFKFKYPKISLLIALTITSYALFSNQEVVAFISRLEELKYFGMFIAGIFLSFGFTSPIAAGFFIVSNPSSIIISGLIAGLGAMLGNLLIFNIISFSFTKEFKRLERTEAVREMNNLIEKDFGKKIKNFLLYAVIGIIISSPLPDEFGIIMLAGLTKINQGILAATSFILHTIGILILLSI